MNPKTAVPDAVQAVVAAVMQEHPGAGPALLARLVVAELRDLGWHITPGPAHTARPPAPPDRPLVRKKRNDRDHHRPAPAPR